MIKSQLGKRATEKHNNNQLLICCGQIDAYNEDVLSEERERLRDTNPFTVLEYIKTSIEILMNMKMEEQQDNKQESKKQDDKRRNRNTRQSKQRSLRDGDDDNAEESSIVSGDEAPSEFESIL